ncbi:MAG TPA: tRNA pseudouridine(55) synthase TruB [Rhabdochlamydiaceae bacterium]|jgi:tRNA pseudouridine55 synthase
MIAGILPINKPTGKTSFSLVHLLRKLTHVQKIGHTGTLDPFASGVMILLIGKKYTRQSDQLLSQDKEYHATLHLGITTDSYDIDGQIVQRSSHVPAQEEVQQALLHFQGTLLQTPPMYSAKKVQGKKLYEYARKGISLEREPVQITLRTSLLSYNYPYLNLHVHCTKGTYIRSLAYDLGLLLGCGAHLSALTRIRNGNYTLSDCCDGARLADPHYAWQSNLIT